MNKTKLRQSDILKINSRYESKLLEFSTKSTQELSSLLTTKMSMTDRHALLKALNNSNKIIVNKDGTDSE
jgi:hypothetical protein